MSDVRPSKVTGKHGRIHSSNACDLLQSSLIIRYDQARVMESRESTQGIHRVVELGAQVYTLCSTDSPEPVDLITLLELPRLLLLSQPFYL